VVDLAPGLGDDPVPVLRARGQPGAVSSASITPQRQPALDRVAWLTATLRQGEWAGATLAQRQAESERQGQRRGMWM